MVADATINTNLTEAINKQIDEIDKKIKDFKTNFSDSAIFSLYVDKDTIKPKLENNHYKIDLSGIATALSTANNKLGDQIEVLKKKIDQEKNNTLTQAYGMEANIFNYFKILVAHMETFYNLIDSCANKIKLDREFGNIPINSTDGNIKYNKNSGNPILPPFPWYSQIGVGGGNKREDAWIGTVNPNLEEVDLIKKLIKSQTEMEKEVNAIIASDPSKEPNTVKSGTSQICEIYTEPWFPIHPFDNPISLIGGNKTSPWENVSELSDSDIYDRLYLRSTILTNFIPNKELISLAIAETHNIYDNTYLDEHKKNRIKGQINILLNKNKSGNFSNKDLTYNFKDKFGEYVPLYINTTDDYKKYLLNNSNASSPDGRKWFAKEYFENVDITNKNPTFNKKDFREINQVRYKIVNGNENCDLISKEYYLKLLDKANNYPQKFGEILSEYYFFDSKKINRTYLDYNNKDSFPITKAKDTSYNCINKMSIHGRANQILGSKDKSDEKTAYENADINPNNFYIKNLDINKQYYLYNGNTNEKIASTQNTILSFIKKENIKPTSYPFIGGNNEGHAFSLFGHPFYYKQNNVNTEDKNKNIDIKFQALLFLNTLDLNMLEIEKILLGGVDNNRSNPIDENRNSFMARVSKTGLLLLGGTLWRSKIGKEFIGYKSINLPKKNEYFRVNNILTFESKIKKPKFDKCNLFYTTDKTQINCVLDPIEQKELINLFEEFVKNEWLKISVSFELLNADNTHKLNASSLSKIITTLSNTKTDRQEKTLSYLFGNSLDNYINISEYSIKDAFLEEINPSDYPESYFNEGEPIGFLKLINKDNTVGVNTIIDLILTDSIIAYSGYYVKLSGKIENTIKKIKENLFDFYNDKNTSILGLKSAKTTTPVISSVDEHVDRNLTTYTYIKTIYDKWVSGWTNLSDKPYRWITKDVIEPNSQKFKSLPITNDNYYIKNFRFIDRAHNDIGVDMLIDYRDLLNIVSSDINQKTLFSTMTDALQKNQMLFLPMPSYQSFGSLNDFTKIFKPLSFSESKMVDNEGGDIDSSMYLCMYAGRPSSRLDQGKNSSFKDDSFSLNKPYSIPADYNYNHDNKVPAIAVNFGQQNQQYFKNYSLNMANPNTTDASIKVLQNLNERANQNSTVEPIGQDLYSLYSQYSYTCDVEMMGCAQIQPMMYFQLNNIPMWNGAYMIFKVKHSIKPGTMVTNFSGMRMAKTYPKLVTENAITFKLLNSLDGMVDLGAPTETGSDTKYIDVVKGQKFNPDTDHFEIINYIDGNKKITERIYNRLSFLSKHVEIIYKRWKEAGMPDFIISSGYRTIDENKSLYANLNKNRKTPLKPTNSAHVLGLGIDLKIPNNNNGRDIMEKLRQVVVEMMKEGINIDQLFLETEDNSKFLVHIGLGQWAGETPIPKMDGDRYTSRGEVNDYKNYIPVDPSCKHEITSAKWPNQGDVTTSVPTTTNRKENELTVFTKLKESGLGLEKYQVAAIMGNIFVETDGKFNPDATNAKDNNGKQCYGLIQWNTGSYPHKNATLDELKSAVGNSVDTQIAYLTNMPNYPKWKNTVRNEQGSIKASKSAYDFARLIEICWECDKGETTYNNNTTNKKRSDMAYDFYNRMFRKTDQLYWS